MDILSDILHVAGLRRRLLDLHALTPEAALRFPCERSFGLHTVTRGRAFVHAPNLDEPIELSTGDLVLMARGCVHLLSLDRLPPGRSVTVPIARFAGEDQTPVPDTGATQVISAAYQLWHDPLHPFLRSLPPWFVIRAGSLPQLSALPLTIGLLDRELSDQDLGAASVTHGLLDALFAFALREIAQREQQDTPGWNQAIADRQIRQVITLMHGNLAHGWTLEELGQRVGLSRSALAERFRSALGDTPLNHLRTLRMQKAIQLLSETRQTLEQIAQAVGYQDAFGFSKVFKRTTGQSPRQFREQDAKEKLMPFRLQEA
ncbi:cupin domain-containing protein [Hydrogenophaga sp. RWCD_12]|uniref:AraC family transcriptional regulator n=1 Tax=Hydrogenophaga sp. RWCD_12 TaxID=3391190 RepID=UPI00398465EF